MASDAPETNDQSQNQATAPAAATAPPAEPLAPGADPSDPPPPMTLSESRMPTRKDISLRELLSKVDECAPIVCANRFAILAEVPLLISPAG